MAYRYGDRFQLGLFPQSIEDYVGPRDPVRAYDAFVNLLDFNELGITVDPHQVGNSEYDPKAMMKLFVYGYSYGVKTSRKLERETHHNLSFIWLMGGLKPDHKTIAEFRRRNKKALRKILKQCARMCLKLGLIEGSVLFVDGTKLRANAARGKTHDQGYYKELLSEIDARIDQLVDECERIDEMEEGHCSLIEMEQELTSKKQLKDRVKEALKTLEETGSKNLNLTDSDCAIMRSIQGSHASYNVQSVVDDKHGLIVHAEAVRDTSDLNQFAEQIDQANAVLGKPCEVACADAGYADTEKLQKIDAQGIKVVVPSQRQALHKKESPFNKSHFRYDKEQDCYWCPEGNRLGYNGSNKEKTKRLYRIPNGKICRQCPHYGQCTSSRDGRRITRITLEELKEKFEAQYEASTSQEIYKRRKGRAELPFGHIKKNLKTDGFLLRGQTGVNAETSLLGTCFNLARMITILGVTGLIEKLTPFRRPVFA